jgi:hypothetical protein
MLHSRPKALISRFSIKEEDQLLLPGRGAGPSSEYLFQVYESCSTHEDTKSRIAGYFVALDLNDGSLPREYEMVMTTFRLLAESNFTHVNLILTAVKMHPWTLQVPELTAYYQKFAEECSKFEELPTWQRKYHRILFPQSQFYFRSADYRPLTAVAHSLVKDVEKTYEGYQANSSEHKELIDKVQEYKRSYVPAARLTGLAELLGVPWEELPGLPRPATAAAPADVVR